MVLRYFSKWCSRFWLHSNPKINCGIWDICALLDHILVQIFTFQRIFIKRFCVLSSNHPYCSHWIEQTVKMCTSKGELSPIDQRCIPICVLMYYSILFCSLNTIMWVVFTLKIPKAQFKYLDDALKGLVHFQNKKILIIYSPPCHPRCSCLSFFSQKKLRCLMIFIQIQVHCNNLEYLHYPITLKRLRVVSFSSVYSVYIYI